MFYDDSPLSTLLNVGMWGFSFFCGHKHGEASAFKKIEAHNKECEIANLRRQVEELKRMITPTNSSRER